MTADTSWLDHRSGSNDKSKVDILDEDELSTGLSPSVARGAGAKSGRTHDETEPKATGGSVPAEGDNSISGTSGEHLPSVAGAEAGQDDSTPPLRTLGKRIRLSEEPTPFMRDGDGEEAEIKTPPLDAEGDILMPIEKTMKAIARRAAARVQAECKLSILNGVDRSEYRVEFIVDGAGKVLGVEPGGALLHFVQDRCVEHLAISLVPSFAGATDLQPRFTFGYPVVK